MKSLIKKEDWIAEYLKEDANSWWQLYKGNTEQTPKREQLVSFLENVTSKKSLVLWLGELQWSHEHMAGLIPYLAGRLKSEKLLLIASYRTPIASKQNHSITKIHDELVSRNCLSLDLKPFDAPTIAAYFDRRFSVPLFDSSVTSIQEYTGGNPYIINKVIEYLTETKILERGDDDVWIFHDNELGVHEDFKTSIHRKTKSLAGDNYPLLEVASVAGVTFTTAALAAALKKDIDFAEECCRDLMESTALIVEIDTEEWPDGTETTCYQFTQSLYKDVIYEQITSIQRKRLHQRIGERLEHGYQNEEHRIADELAKHFKACRDKRAFDYIEQLNNRLTEDQPPWIHVEILQDVLEFLPEDHPKHDEIKLNTQSRLASARAASEGWGNPNVQTSSLMGIYLEVRAGSHIMRANYSAAIKYGEKLSSLARKHSDAHYDLLTCSVFGIVYFSLGKPEEALYHLEKGRKRVLVDGYKPTIPDTFLRIDPVVTWLSFIPVVTWILGYTSQALNYSEKAINKANELNNKPHSQSLAYCWAALFHHFRCDIKQTEKYTDLAMNCAKKNKIPHYMAMANYLNGWVLTKNGSLKEGIDKMQQGTQSWLATIKDKVFSQAVPWKYGFLAEAYRENNQIEQAYEYINKAFEIMGKTQERACEAELERIKGLIYKQERNSEKAEEHLWKAVTVSQQQKAKSWELRARIHHYRFKQEHKTDKELQELRRPLQSLYNHFRAQADNDNPDLQEAEKLLNMNSR